MPKIRTALRVGAKWRWDGALVFFLALQPIITPAVVSAQSIRPDGRTATTVTGSGAVQNVSTATVVKTNAFNSFHAFSVPGGNVVNLHVPTAAANLINIVRDERTNVHGILNAIKDGRIGGNVWFANPHGFVVGATGVVNVGSVTVTTPTQAFVDNFFLAPGSPNEAAVAQLLAGTAPRSGTGLISIQGTVNAADGISLLAGTINVGGTLYSGARFIGTAPDFSDVVNANGLVSATNVVAKEGRIAIVADNDVTVAGTIAAPGGPGVRGGDISVRAGGNLELNPGANIVASGLGENSAGGTVYLWGDNNATFRQGALIDASAGTSGDGGFIELSAKNNVELAGGEFRAGARQGRAGSILIDPTTITASTSGRITDGANITFAASDSITVNPDVVISSRNVPGGTTEANLETALSEGDSGNITVQAPTITLKPGSKILAHANNGFTAGDVTLSAQKNDSTLFMGQVSAQTRIEVDGATVRGKDITLDASSTAAKEWLGDPASFVTAAADSLAGLALFAFTGVNVGVVLADGKSEVLVKNSSILDAQGSGGTRGTVTLNADATARAKSLTLGLGAFTSNQLFNAGFVYGQADATATVDVQSGASIKAGDLRITATNTAETDLTVLGFSTAQTMNAAAVVNRANVISTATIASGASVDANRSVLVKAQNTNTFSAGATSMALETGQVGFAVNYTELSTSATAANNANLTTSAPTSVTVEAFDRIAKNKATASTAVGSSLIASKIVVPVLNAAQGVGDKLFGRVGSGPQQLDSTAGQTQKPKLAAAVTYADNRHTATASIGAGAQVTSSGDVAVAAKVSDERIRTHASSSIDGQSEPNNPGTSIGLSAAVSIGLFDHEARAFVGDNAIVTAPHIGVRSEVAMPYEITWAKWEGISTILSKLSSNLGIADGLLSGWANATTGGTTGASLAGAVAWMDFDNVSLASVGRDAQLKVSPGGTNAWSTALAGGTVNWLTPVQVHAQSDVAGVYVGGNMSLLINGAGGEPGATSVGGAYSQVSFDNTTRAWVSEGAEIVQTSGSPVNVTVDAQSHSQITAVAPSAGRGGSYGANIIFSRAQADDRTEASIDDEAKVTANRVDVKAKEDVVVWSLAGAFTMSDSAGVGAGVAMNDVSTDTKARIGDNDANNAGGSMLSLTTGKTVATDIALLARTDGRIEAIGVAGAAASSSDPADGPGFKDKVKSGFSNLVVNKFPGLAGKLGLGAGPGAPPVDSQPKFGLAVAGSAGVNVVDLVTRATVEGAKLEFPTTGASSLAVTAVNDTDITAAAGSASLVRANNPSSSWSAGVAGSVAVNQIANTTEAAIRSSNVTDAQDVALTALAGGEQLAVAIGATVNASADQSKSASVAGSVSVSLASNTTAAKIENSTLTGQATGPGRDLDVIAYERLNLGTGGGSLIAGGRAGIGAAVSYSEISNTTEAAVSGSTVTNYDEADVHGLSATRIGAGAAMGGVQLGNESGGTLGGAFAISDIGNTVKAEIRGGSSVTTASQVDVLAADTTGVAAFNTIIDAEDGVDPNPVAAAQMDYDGTTFGQSASPGSSIISVGGVLQVGRNNVGMSFAYNKIHNSFTAALRDSTVSAGASGTVNVIAESNTRMLGIAAGVGFAADKFAGAGSLTLSETTNAVTAEATSATGQAVTAGTLTVKAEDKSKIESVAGQITISAGQAAVGAAVAHNQIANTVRAKIEGADIDARSATAVRSANDSTIRTLAAAGGGSQTFAFNGSAASALITNTTEAAIVNAKADDTTNAVSVTAEDTSQIQSLSGAVGLAGSTAVGLAIAVNRIDNTTRAHMSGTASGGNYAVKSLVVRSDTDASIESIAVGVGGGLDVGVAGSVATNFVDSGTEAYIDQGAKVVAENNVGVIAESDDRILIGAGAAGIGLSAAGVGASVTVNKIGGSTKAHISGAGTEVAGRALDANQNLTVNEGGFTQAVNLAPVLDFTGYQRLDVRGLRRTETVRGVAVNASATHGIEAINVNVAGGQFAGVSGTTNVNIIGGETLAYVDGGAKINNTPAAGLGQAVSVKSSDHAFGRSFIGSVSVGPLGAGVGLAADVNVFSRNTKAYVTDSTDTRSAGSLTVDATSAQGASSFSVSGAGGIVGVVGTGGVVKFTGTTDAFVRASTLNVGALSVGAEHDSFLDTAGGGVTVGGIAASGTFAVGLEKSITQAYVDGGSAVNTAGTVSVVADSDTTVRNTVISGAGGGAAGVAGMAAVALVENTTQAYVQSSTLGGMAQNAGSVTVRAEDSLTVQHIAGAAGISVGGGYGVGAGAAVTKIDNTVSAFLDSATVHSSGSVTVEAKGERDLSTKAASIGVGGTAGIGGAAAVTLVGRALSGDANNELNSGGTGTIASVQGFANSDPLQAGQNTSSGDALTTGDLAQVNSAARTNVTASVYPGALVGKTSAQVAGASSVTAAGDVKVSASEQDRAAILVGAAGIGGLAIGGAVGVMDITNNVEAKVAGTAQITSSAGRIEVLAEAGKLSPGDRAAKVESFQGSAGFVGLGAAVSIANVTNNITASVERGATTTVASGAGNVTVKATDGTDVETDALGASVGLVAAGAVIGRSAKSGSAVARVGNTNAPSASPDTFVDLASGTLNVQAERTGLVKSRTIAGTGGILAGSGSDAKATDTGLVQAFIGNSVDVDAASGAVNVQAFAEPRTEATAFGINVALGASVGVSLATATAGTQVSAFIGEASSIDAASLTVSAQQRLPVSGLSASASASGASGALLAGINATSAEASSLSQVGSYVDDDTTLNVTGATTVSADNNSAQSASASGIAVGIVAAGANLASATSNTTTHATLGDDVKATGASLAVRATGKDVNVANSTAGSGGVVSGSAATATTSSTSNTLAYTGSGSVSRQLDVDALEIRAAHTTQFNGSVDSVNASLVGASGATANHTVNSTVYAGVGAGGRVLANSVVIAAENFAHKFWLGANSVAADAATNPDNAPWNIVSGSGGLIDLPAGSSKSHMRLATTASVGDNAQVHVMMPALGNGNFNMDAYNEIIGHDKAKLDSGGAVAVAKAVSHLFVDQADASVVFGPNSQVISDLGDVNAGARSHVNLATRASADTYGLAGAPSGEAYSVYNGHNQATVNTGVLIRADDGNVNLAGGQSSGGTPTSITANSNVNLWNKTAIPISTNPDAQSNIVNNASVRVLGTSNVEASANIALSADKGAVNANATGIGKDIYREAAAAIASGISNLFGGGDVSFDIHGGSTSVGGAANVVVDGTVLAGIHRTESLTLDVELLTTATCGTPPCVENGRIKWRLVPTATDGVTFTVDPAVGIAANIQKRIDKLRSRMAQYAGDPVAVAAYQSEIAFLEHKLVELGLAGRNADGSINVGQWNNPSPRAAAEQQIVQFRAQESGATSTVNTAATTVRDTAASAVTAENTIVASAGTIDTNAGTVVTNNSTIQTSLQSLANFSASNATYQATYIGANSLVSTNATLRSEINTRKTANDADRATVSTRSGEINTLLADIAATTVQSVIDTKQAEIASKTEEIKTLLSTISTRNGETSTRAGQIVANNATIDSNQAALITAFRGGSGDDGTVTNINNTRASNNTPRTNISNASSTISTQQALFTGGTGFVTTIATQDTTIDAALADKTSAQTQIANLTASLPTLSTVPANGPIADFVHVDDITVRLGNIRVKADNLTGTGALRAPGDAQITITNTTPDFLVVNDLTIASDEGGTLRLNGVLVNSPSEINRVNASGTGANALTVVTRDTQSAPKPAIVIQSNYDPDGATYANLPAPAPNIELDGEITNLRGSVTVHSKAGSILSNGVIRAGTVDVKAENGDFVQSFVDNFFHTGGDPASIQDQGTALGAGIIANGSVFVSARYLNINSLIQSGIEQWALTLPSDATLVLTGPAGLYGLNQTALNNALNAFKNATGPQFTNFTPAGAPAGAFLQYNAASNRIEANIAFANYDRTTSGWAARTAGFNGLYPLVQSGSDNIGANFDPVTDRFVLDGEAVRGGYIQLFGQIINTSNNGAGKLRVLDGYGQITITNPTGRSVVLNRLDAGADPTGTGRGTAGVIDIMDVRGINPDNTSSVIHSVYTRDYNVATGAASLMLTQEIGTLGTGGVLSITSSTSGADAKATDGRHTGYDPQTGRRFVWTTGTDNSSVKYWHFEGNQIFGFIRTSQPSGSVISQSGPFVLNSYRLDDGTYLSTGAALGGAHATGSPHFASTSVNRQTGASTWVKTGEWTNCNWWTLCIASTYNSTWTETIPNKTITTKSLKGDYPIAIEFSGLNQGVVTVNSASNVILNGDIRNNAGTTTITAGSGVTPLAGVSTANRSIIQGNDTALITTKDLTLNATGSVGASLDANPARSIQTLLTSSVLNATAGNGNVLVTQTVGDMKIGTVSAAGNAPSGTGRVVLQSDGSILADSTSSLIQGERIELTSENGAIGSIATPLKVNVGYSSDPLQRRFYGLKAAAAGDIGLTAQTWSGNSGGDLLVDTVVSTAGDVKLTAPGRILDNNPLEQIDTRTFDELKNFWDSLGLRAGQASNLDKRAKAIQAYEFGRTQDYQIYWLIRSRQADPSAFDPNFQFVATPTERSVLAGQFKAQNPALTDAQVDAKIAEFETNRTQQYRRLNTDVGSLNNGTFSQTFTYVASQAEKDGILKGSSWTDRELGISITPGLLKDITNTNPVVKSPNVQGRNVTLAAGTALGETQTAITVPTNILPENLTDAQKVALAAAERSDLTITDSLITVLQRKPVNFDALTGLTATVMAAPAVNTDNGNAYLASLADGRLASIQAPGEVRVKVRGSIVNAGAGPAVQSGNLILEAANGGIGFVPPSTMQPLRISLNPNATLIARAADNVDIVETGDINVDTVFSRKDVKLTAAGSIKDAFADAELNVLADTMTLTAQNGSIGSAANPLDVGVNPTGRITATATPGGVYLHGPLGSSFNIAQVTAGDIASLNADVNMLIDGPVQGPGQVGLVAGGDVSMTANAAVTAGTIGALINSDSLTMADGASLTVGVGTISITTAGDAIITGISTLNPNESAIVINSGGRVLSAGDSLLDVIANSGPAAKLTINAVGGIGNDPLNADVLNLDATSANGVIHFAAQNSVNVGTVQAAGEVLLTAGSSITGSTMTSSGGPVNASAFGGQVNLANVSGQTGANVSGQTGVTLATVSSAGGSIAANSAAGNVNVATASANQNVSLGAPAGSITATGTVAAAGGSVTMSASGDVAVTSPNSARAGLDVALSSTQGSVSAAAITAGRDVNISAGQNVALGTVTAANAVTADAAGGNLTANSVTGNVVNLSALGTVSVPSGTAHVGSLLNLGADRIFATVDHTGRIVFLQANVSNRGGGPASLVELTVTSPLGVHFGTFSSLDAALLLNSGLDITNGFIANRATIANPVTLLLMDQNNRNPQPADIQLYAPNLTFRLNLSGRVLFTDAFVIQHNELTHSVLSFSPGINPDVRQNVGRGLAIIENAAQEKPGELLTGETGDLVSHAQVPVTVPDCNAQPLPEECR